MTAFLDALDVLLDDARVTLGACGRLGRVSKDVRARVRGHALFYRGVALHVARAPTLCTYERLVRSVLSSHARCRECGARGATRVFTRAVASTFVCTRCAADQGGYCELLSRKQIVARTGRGGRSQFRRLVFAKCTRNNRYLYWASSLPRGVERDALPKKIDSPPGSPSGWGWREGDTQMGSSVQ